MVDCECVVTSLFYYCAENETGIFDAILQGQLDFSADPWPALSSGAKDLVRKMLKYDPKERLSAAEVLSKTPSYHVLMNIENTVFISNINTF